MIGRVDDVRSRCPEARRKFELYSKENSSIQQQVKKIWNALYRKLAIGTQGNCLWE